MKLFAGVLAALGLMSPALAEERFPQMTQEQMDPAQKKVADTIMASRKNLSGPFSPWLRSPELANRMQAVGEYVRYNSAFTPPQSEFAILVVARAWTSQLEWNIHYPIATAAGVKPEVLADLAANRRPRGMDEDQSLIYDFSIAMQHDKGNVSDALFDKVKSRFGEKKMLDLLGLNAYYAAAAMTINLGQVPLPEGTRPPLK